MKHKYLVKISLMILFIFILTYISTFFITAKYKKDLITNSNQIISKIIQEHPELETDLIESMNNDSYNYQDILSKYGINESNIFNLAEYKRYQKQIIVINSLFSGTILIVFITIYYQKLKKETTQKQILIEYINAILNDDFNFSFQDYEETKESLEINSIYQLTNKLKKQKDDLIQEKRILEDVLSDISHQIKTPLTSLTVINELILADNLPKKEKIKFINKSNNQLERIEWLVSSLLKLAKMDNKSIVFKKEAVDLNKLFKELEIDLELNLELKSQKLIIDKSKITVINDYNWLKEAIYNILKNASDYGDENSNIEINLDDNPIYTQIQIINEGPEIEKEELKNLFKRFYKGKHSSPSSVGIGLNMAKNILENNQGNITVKSKNNKTTFEMRLYKNIK